MAKKTLPDIKLRCDELGLDFKWHIFYNEITIRKEETNFEVAFRKTDEDKVLFKIKGNKWIDSVLLEIINDIFIYLEEDNE